MTSKEGLEMLCDLCNTNVNCYQKKQCTIYKKIEEDLEVMELIKKILLENGHITNVERVDSWNVKIVNGYVYMTDGEIDSIKEWLKK